MDAFIVSDPFNVCDDDFYNYECDNFAPAPIDAFDYAPPSTLMSSAGGFYESVPPPAPVAAQPVEYDVPRAAPKMFDSPLMKKPCIREPERPIKTESCSSSSPENSVQSNDGNESDSEIAPYEAVAVETVAGIPRNFAMPAVLGGNMPKPPRHRRPKKEKPEDDGSDSDAPERLQIRLPRETLLGITSENFEEYAGYLHSSMKLTKSQEKEVRRMRRLVKNRESARVARQRKLDHVSMLQQEIAQLNAENQSLRSENARLRQILTQIGGANFQIKSEPLPPRIHPTDQSNTIRLSSVVVLLAIASIMFLVMSFIPGARALPGAGEVDPRSRVLFETQPATRSPREVFSEFMRDKKIIERKANWEPVARASVRNTFGEVLGVEPRVLDNWQMEENTTYYVVESNVRLGGATKPDRSLALIMPYESLTNSVDAQRADRLLDNRNTHAEVKCSVEGVSLLGRDASKQLANTLVAVRDN